MPNMPKKTTSSIKSTTQKQVRKRIDPRDKPLGKRLHYIRTDVLHKTIEEMAEFTGASTSSVYRYEAGTRTADIWYVLDLAAKTGTSLSWLLSEETLSQTDNLNEKTEPYRVQPSTQDNSPVRIPAFGTTSGPDQPEPVVCLSQRWVYSHFSCNVTDLSVTTVSAEWACSMFKLQDLLLINHADSQPGHGIYMLRINDIPVIKRIQHIPGNKLEICNLDEPYSPFIVKRTGLSAAGVKVIGRIIWTGKTI